MLTGFTINSCTPCHIVCPNILRCDYLVIFVISYNNSQSLCNLITLHLIQKHNQLKYIYSTRSMVFTYNLYGPIDTIVIL